MSFKPEVITDTSGKWCGNALRFATREEAQANVRDLMMRWFAVRETRVVASDDLVNYRYVNGRLESLTLEAATPPQRVLTPLDCVSGGVFAFWGSSSVTHDGDARGPIECREWVKSGNSRFSRPVMQTI